MFYTRLALTFASAVFAFIVNVVINLLLSQRAITWGNMAFLSIVSVAITTYIILANLLPAEGIIRTFLTQEIVDQKLSELALKFHNAARDETKLQHEILASTDVTEERIYQDRMRGAKNICEGAKKAFWEAHGLAKTRGFKVKDSYKEYLPLRAA